VPTLIAINCRWLLEWRASRSFENFRRWNGNLPATEIIHDFYSRQLSISLKPLLRLTSPSLYVLQNVVFANDNFFDMKSAGSLFRVKVRFRCNPVVKNGFKLAIRNASNILTPTRTVSFYQNTQADHFKRIAFVVWAKHHSSVFFCQRNNASVLHAALPPRRIMDFHSELQISPTAARR
jgi:hypothetical protein